MGILSTLEPKNVFHYFEEICAIPHGSGNTKQISDYFKAFAEAHDLKYRQEKSNNIIIWKEASAGYENAPTVILQGHMDMVTVKTADCTIDMQTEGLDPAVTEDGEWVYAKGTSLGGDDGIAAAYALAILADDELSHPALEVVLTVDEEIGLLGAAALDASDLKGRILMNMDSEDDGIFLIGCAGGATVKCAVPYRAETVSGAVYEWKIDGLRGGHSGNEIWRERANANVLLGRFLAKASERISLRIGGLQGGEKDNAIANNSRCLICVDSKDEDALKNITEEFETVVKNEYAVADPNLAIHLIKLPGTELQAMDETAAKKFIFLLSLLPNGVQKRIAGMEEMVQTSLNMGVLAMTDGEASVTFSARSSIESEKYWMIDRMKMLSEFAGGYCTVSGAYPGWSYDPDSKIRPLMMQIYEELTGVTPKAEAIHAGVECGLLADKLPGLDCISYGPQMRDIHTVNEKLNIVSVQRNYKMTCETLKRLK